MNLTTASMDSNDDKVGTRNMEPNEFIVRGGIYIFLYKSITIGYEYNFDCNNILSQFFRSLPHGESLTLYSSLWAILILHLLII